jgi:uncharacterized damage-inducible protein DinB
MLPAIRTLYAYSAWANARVLDAAARLSPAQFLMPGPGGAAIQDTLVHTISAQWVWLRRWQGASPGALWDPAEFADLATLRTRWSAIEEETEAYLAGLTEADLARVISYVNFQGEPWAYPLWQQLMHQVNHATQHRSEVALMLTERGCSPGWLDLLVYLDQATDRTREGEQ